MSIILSANYKEVLEQETVDFIEENCIEGEYDLDDALEFIDNHNEKDFVRYYDEYIRVGENLGYDVVDAFIEHQGDVCYVENVEEAYHGYYDSKADFAEYHYRSIYDEVPFYIVVDWQATWDQNLRDDFDFVDGYVFSSNF